MSCVLPLSARARRGAEGRLRNLAATGDVPATVALPHAARPPPSDAAAAAASGLKTVLAAARAAMAFIRA